MKETTTAWALVDETGAFVRVSDRLYLPSTRAEARGFKGLSNLKIVKVEVTVEVVE